MLKFTDRPYGAKLAARPQFPQNAQPIATAPQNAADPIRVFEPNGKAYPAMYYKGAWRKTVTERDPYSETMRARMTGDIVNNPVAWTSS